MILLFSTSQVARIIGVSHHTHLKFHVFNINKCIFKICIEGDREWVCNHWREIMNCWYAKGKEGSSVKEDSSIFFPNSRPLTQREGHFLSLSLWGCISLLHPLLHSQKNLAKDQCSVKVLEVAGYASLALPGSPATIATCSIIPTWLWCPDTCIYEVTPSQSDHPTADHRDGCLITSHLSAIP
jgi:hypothetical protein